MSIKSIHLIDKKLGHISIVEQDGYIIEVNFDDKKDIMLQNSELLKKAKKQVIEYLGGQRKSFDLPLKPHGTEFQIKAWKALQKIPYGHCWSYKMQAEQLNKPKASRAVGRANSKNPIPIIIPCHRVIGANGKLTGFAGGLDKKKHLLELEGHSLG